ncbi:SDR family oxidoreductase [Microvirga pudoricolor]|uniref:SDR family oxidoreductase n=1 Tax=Microvirga pudoricolor TaxID=2778729 RepID=UPI00194E6ED1|nr:SDR family oxidoreductase [Microvirga pudoricolor]MBM6594430.1 SDR family oxidoreductase [Microvirga pudoricolor]
MARKTVLIAGASGVVGQAALEHFLGRDDWDVVALSRRPPDVMPSRPYRHLPVDLRDAGSCRMAAAGLEDITHVVYTALYEKPGLVRGWRDPEQMEINLSMLRNLTESLLANARGLRHMSLLQGTKAYGVHLHPIAVPARESWSRDPHENFYWLQEDYIRAIAATADLGFTIWRPQVIFGDVVGVAMNITPILGVYAAICREEGLPFGFPGGPAYLLEAVDARLLAKALAWATTAPGARNETFNIANGDVFVWQNVWPAIADALGIAPGPEDRRSLAAFLEGKDAVWDRIVVKYGLRPLALKEVLGESHHYADFTFATFAKSSAPPPALVSTIKLRQAGFGDCIDTEDMFRDWFRILRDKRILPPLAA